MSTVKMGNDLPEFYGYSQESIRDFWDSFESYFEVKEVKRARKLTILKVQLRGGGRQEYNAAMTAGGLLARQVAAVPLLPQAVPPNPLPAGWVTPDRTDSERI